MPTYRLDIEYTGSGFSGWARQPGRRTVQGELESALETVLREEVSLTVAGRTDAGVHAFGQVASCELTEAPPARLRRALNGITGRDMSVVSVEAAEPGFDARRDAKSRVYLYRVHTRAAASPFEEGRALWWPYRLDRDALRACAELVTGRHDFTAFTPTQTEHVHFHREVFRCEWRDAGEIVELWIEADAFMRSMVRILTGTMLEVAMGRRDAASLAALLDGAVRKEAGPTAAPHGLYLASVNY